MKTNSGIYLDYNATTPCDLRVVEKMLPFFNGIYGNPSNGLHVQGRLSAEAVDNAREQVASLIGAAEYEVVFTSGATESNNLAILGSARINHGGRRKRIVTTAVEHKAVLLPCKKLEEEGFEVVFLPVDKNGRIDINATKKAITEQTLLVSIQAANNEVGTLQPIKELSEVAHQHGTILHCDAAQAVGKIPVDVNNWGVDMLSISAHKLYGPKGVGALYIRGGSNKIPLEPIWYGGGQENRLRSGTLNVPSIVGFGAACTICSDELPSEMRRIRALRDQLEQSLIQKISPLMVNAHQADRLPNTSSLTLPGMDADALVLSAEKIMIGTGSACTSGAIEPSHVLTAMGLSREDASSTIRVSMGRFTTEGDVEIAINSLLHARDLLVG